MFKFFKGVVQEMKQVVWPTFAQNRRDTAIVVTISVLFAAYLGLLDWAFSALTQVVL